MPRRGKVLLALVMAAVLGWAGLLVTIVGQGVEQGSLAWHEPDADVRNADAMTEVRYAFEPGGHVTFGASVRNPGPWPVTISAVTVGNPGDYQVFPVAHAEMIPYGQTTPGTYGPAAATPFSPTTVEPGEELAVFLTVTIPEAEMAPGSGLFFDDLAVSYAVFGFMHHQRIPMTFRLAVYAADNAASPVQQS